MSYVFNNADHTSVLRDDVVHVPWDPANNRPLDYDGQAGRLWIEAGSPIPDPYVARPPTADEARITVFNADTDRQTLVDQIKTATPAQIKNYINTNVTDLASARQMLMRLTLLVAKYIRD